MPQAQGYPGTQLCESMTSLCQRLTEVKSHHRKETKRLPGTNRLAGEEHLCSGISEDRWRYYCKSGDILHHGLETIEPGAKDCTLFVKKAFTACGSVGVLTFQFNDRQSQRLAILFSNPFNHILYDCTFGLHFTKTGVSARQLYEDMYSHGERLENSIKACKNTVIQLPHKLVHNGVQVTATMSAQNKSILRVVVEDSNEDRPAAGKGNSGKGNSGNTYPRGYSLHVSDMWNHSEDFKTL